MKNVFKKTTVLLLAIVIAIGSTVSIMAAEVSHKADKTLISAGEDVTITLTLDETIDNVVSFDFYLYYDADLVTLKSSANGTAHEDMTVSNAKTDRKGNTYYGVSVIDAESVGLTVEAGTVYTFVFTASEDVTESTDAVFELVNKGVYTPQYSTIDVDVTADVSVEIHVHSYTSAVTKNPSCVAKGETTYTCSCGDSYTEEIATVDHTEVADAAKAPTCTDTGLTAGSHCSVCGTVIVAQEEIEADGHSYGDWVETTAPTCTEEGENTKTCSVCGDEVTEAIPATGHSHKGWVVTTEPTCTETGVKTQTCPDCGDEVTETIPATGHTYGDWTVTTAPTCTEKGEQTKTCSACGDEVTEEVAATGHTYGGWTVTTAPTCTEKGEQTKTCSVCGDEVTEEVAATGHTYGDWTVTTAPTCTEKGEQTKACSACGDEVTEEVAATGHTYGEPTVTTAPTCTEKGEQTKTCSACGDEVTEEVAATGHAYGEWVVTKEPTTTEVGEKTQTCEHCGDVVTEEIPVIVEEPDDDNGDAPQTGDKMMLLLILMILSALTVGTVYYGRSKKMARK